MGDNGKLQTPINGLTSEPYREHSSIINNRPESKKLSKLIIPDSHISFDEDIVVPTKPVKKKRRDKSDLGDNFVAPDGGWGWLVSIACGVSILVSLILAQQFGIIFRDHMPLLGISNSKLTTIINIQVALSAISGLLNGPLFRRFSYRQVALVGSIITFIGLFTCSFADSFLLYVISFSCCYGLGRGLTLSASSLAVNTYFKEKRRTATAYQFGVAGLGPILCPYVATFLLDTYGVKYTVLFFAALSLNNIACSLIYQPVKWHVKKPPKDVEALRKLSVVNKTEVIAHPIEPETPVLPRANDGWYGSKTSLNTPSIRNRLNSIDRQKLGDQTADIKTPSIRSRLNSFGKPMQGEQMMELKALKSMENRNNAAKIRSFSVSESIKEDENEYFDCDDDHHHNVTVHNEFQQIRQQEIEEILIDEAEEKERRKKMPWYKKVAVFFDLGLLRDFTYVSLSMGLTLINFVEINFGILTPFILGDFGYQKHQIAMAMSVLGVFDLIIRFLIPMITAKINLSNQAFFVLGILGMTIGRIVLTFTRNFYAMMAIFVWLGLNKAFRIVFMSLIIPGYVPLKRLPAAAGLQLLMTGIFSLAFGPVIGLMRDRTNYAFTLNVLNGVSLFALTFWGLESMVRKYRNKSHT